MKYILTPLFLLAFLGLQVNAADDSRQEKKEAVAWVKTSADSKKKLITAAKKVKNEKSAEKFAKDVAKIYDALSVEGKETGMGKTVAATAPSSDSMSAELEKKSDSMKKLDDALDKELERIEGLNIESSSLDKALEQISKIRDLLG